MKNKLGRKNRMILDHLRKQGSITGRQAWALYGVYRLSSVINRFRNEFGHDAIKTVMQRDAEGVEYANYVWNEN